MRYETADAFRRVFAVRMSDRARQGRPHVVTLQQMRSPAGVYSFERFL